VHRKPFLLLPLLLLTACAVPPRLGPAPQPRGPGTVAASQSLAQAPARDWPADRWWQAWGDPQLDALVAEALAGNPDLKMAVARLEAADAAARQSRAGLRPTLAANASGGGQQLSRNLGIPPQFVPRGILEQGLINLQAGWTIDLWGQGRAALRAARGEAAAVAVEAAQARLMLAASVAAAYAEFAAALEAERVATRAETIRRQTLALTAERVAAGLDNDGARAQAASRLALAAADRAAAAQQVRVARHRLALLLGAGPDRGNGISSPTLKPLPPGLPGDAAVALMARRPDLVAARLRAVAAGWREVAARRSFLPNLTLNAIVGQQSLGFDTLLDGGSRYAQFGPALSLPILDGGRRAADLTGARASRAMAVAQHDATLLRALNEVADAASAATALDAQDKAARTALAEARAAQKVAALRYEAGLSNQLLVLTADDAVVAAEQAAAGIAAARLQADVALVRALGGGYRNEETR
jgi:NodT family efflux transporter outer membrane factor (OMF) lipoprotein